MDLFMKRAITSAFAVFLISTAMSQHAAAAPLTLFESLPNVTSASFTGQLVSIPNSYSNAFRVYDQFTLSAAANITSAAFLVYSGSSSNLPQQGALGIYSVSNGVAGTALFSQVVSTSAVTPVSDPNAYGLNLYRVTVAPSNITLDAGSYFISLAGMSNPFAIVTFALNDAANPVTQSAFSYQSFTGPLNSVAAYSVSGTVVPEPSMLALLSMGAAGAFAARRRRKPAAARGQA